MANHHISPHQIVPQVTHGGILECSNRIISFWVYLNKIYTTSGR